MDKTAILMAMPINQLRAELEARTAQAKKLFGAPPSDSLREVDTVSIINTIAYKQKAIYGVDDRMDIYEVDDPRVLTDADSVVALFRASDVLDKGDGTSSLVTNNYGTLLELCASERFRDQPTGAFCSGVLVASDVVATAGHCANSRNVTNIRFVFGFRMENSTAARLIAKNEDIYKGLRVIGRQELSAGPDWALVQLDRPVTNHPVARLRRTGKIADGEFVHVVGHPSGLPMKSAGGATVRDNSPSAFFIANLDTYGGNSGSPIFSSVSHEVEAVLSRGEVDFVERDGCKVSLVCPSTGCRGEDCTRTTEFAHLLATPTTATGWRHEDLTAAAAAAPAIDDPTTLSRRDGSLHLLYRGHDNHVHNLFWDGAWRHEDLSAAAGAVPDAAGRPVVFALDSNGAERVTYRGPDAHFHALWWDGAWRHEDLTAAAAAAPAIDDPTTLSRRDGSLHLLYRGHDNHVHNLFWDGAWRHEDLSAAAGAVPDAAGRPVVFALDSNGAERVTYRGPDAHFHALWWDGAWRHEDLTAAAAAAPAIDDPTTLSRRDGSLHLLYRGHDNHVHNLFWDGAWRHEDLSAAAGAVPDAAGRPVVFALDSNGAERVTYRGPDAHFHALWWDGAWRHEDLTAAAAGVPAVSDPTVTVRSADGSIHLVYRDADGNLHDVATA